MGFLGGFLEGLGFVNGSDRELLDAANADYNDELSKDYRSNGLANTDSNYGWYTCPKCGRKFRDKQMDADHIVPKSKGGDNTRNNIQMLCYHCNRSKSNNTDDTDSDLARRRQELKKQDKEDRQFLNSIK